MLNSRYIGGLIRLPLRLIPPTTILPVLAGPTRGMRWIVGSAPHGSWLGTSEREQLANFLSCIRSGMIVWDIGASVGLYTLPSARAVQCSGCVYAFEPMTRNLGYLRQHLSLN